ncbi:MAG: SDR family oxidoreductase [Alphaproteobacteria bacterium]
MSSPVPRLFVFGLGYVGAALARAMAADGWTVAGTLRDMAPAPALEAAGIAVHRFAADAPLDPSALAGATHLLATAAPEGDRDPVLAAAGAELARLPGLDWVGYVSSTGVYGDRAGGWVDAATPPAPTSAHAKRRLRAEEAWRDLWRHRGLPVHVFRAAGIYGPGRSAIDQLRAGSARRIVRPGQVFSRIHVDDIVAALRASMARPDPGAIYDLADDAPAPQDEVVAHAAALIGMPAPPPEPFEVARATMSAMALAFYGESRRVSNARTKAALGLSLAYPTYREGLAAIAAST